MSDVLNLLGERWMLLVVREVSLGLRRFDELQTSTGAPRTVLADRLRRLTGAGILQTRGYRIPRSRVRLEYTLTEAGLDLLPVLAALSDWTDRHVTGSAEPDVVYHHRGCGGRLSVRLQCECGEQTGPRDRLIAQVNRQPAPLGTPILN